MRKSMVWHTLWCFEMPTQKHSSIGLSSLREVEWSAAIFVWTKFHFPWDVYISDNIWNDMFDTFGRRIIPSLYAACNLLWKGHQKTTRSLICKLRGQKKPLTVGERILNHCTSFCLCNQGLIFIIGIIFIGIIFRLGLLPTYNSSPSCMQNQGRKYVLYPCNAVPVFFFTGDQGQRDCFQRTTKYWFSRGIETRRKSIIWLPWESPFIIPRPSLLSSN